MVAGDGEAVWVRSQQVRREEKRRREESLPLRRRKSGEDNVLGIIVGLD